MVNDMYIKKFLKSLILPLLFLLSNFILMIVFSFIYAFIRYSKLAKTYDGITLEKKYNSLINSNSFTIDLSNFLNDYSLLIVLLSFIIFLPILIKKYKSFKIIKNDIPKSSYFKAILLGISFALFLNIIFYLLKVNPEPNKFLFTYLISTGILGPILEEYIFRGYLYNKLKSFNKIKTSIILTSLVFALFHVNLIQILYAFIFGIILNIIYEKYQSLKLTIIIHISANVIISLIYSYIILNNILVFLILIISLSILLLTFKSLYTFSKEKG